MSGSYSITPNLGLKKPLTGADDDLWGTHWNENADVLDAAFAGTGSGVALWGILPLAADTAPASGGSGHAVGDVITLTGGATVSVLAIGGGAVTQFNVQRSGLYTVVPTGPMAQVATTGSGTGFAVAPAFGPVAASFGAPALTNGLNGNFTLGRDAGANVTTAGEVCFVGDYAGTSITSGGFNTAFGHRALGFETMGGGNNAFGNDAMRNTRGVTNSVAIGNSALRTWNGSNSIAIGQAALQGNEDGSTTGAGNIAIGILSMNGLTATTANGNTAVGNNTAQGLTTASGNVMVGNSSGQSLTSGALNVLIGPLAGNRLTTANENVMIGYGAGAVATSGGGTMIGMLAGTAVTTGQGNTILGQRAGSKITTGGNNLIIGDQVGSTTLTTGSTNILIGLTSATDTATAGTNDTLKIQGNNTIAAISGTLAGSPVINFPGAKITIGDSGLPTITSGAGAPSANEPNGSLYLRNAGAANTRLYVSAGGGVWAPITSA